MKGLLCNGPTPTIKWKGAGAYQCIGASYEKVCPCILLPPGVYFNTPTHWPLGQEPPNEQLFRVTPYIPLSLGHRRQHPPWGSNPRPQG